MPHRHQQLETSLGLLRKRKERKGPDEPMLALYWLSKPRLVEVMAHLTTLVGSQDLIMFLQASAGPTDPATFTY